MRLLLLGPGYSARAALQHLAAGASWIGATSRGATSRGGADVPAGAEAIPFDGTAPSPALAAALASATHLIVSIPPDPDGDPVLRHHGAEVAAAPLAGVVYLSTVGVYGDHGGAWVDEATEPVPINPRSAERLAAERAWAAATEAPVAALRLSGIYGPGRSAIDALAAGRAHRIVKPGQIFNRIHVADIAAAIAAAFARQAAGPFNVTDDEPAPAPDVVTFAAALMGVAPPPEVPLEAAGLSPMGLSFYRENKRVRNELMKTALGVRLKYPTYREGLTAQWAMRAG